MTTWLRSAVAMALGYGVGSFPTAAVASRVAGGSHDLHAEGTGNPGGMNAAHVLGRRWGLMVTMVDMAKGLVSARTGARIAGPAGANLAATAAVVGHCYPPGRPGGKGVAASVGQVIGTFPSYLPVDFAVAAATSRLSIFRHRTRAATLVASGTWVGCASVAWRRRYRNPGGPEVTGALPVGAAVSSLVIARRFAAEAERVARFNSSQPDQRAEGAA